MKHGRHTSAEIRGRGAMWIAMNDAPGDEATVEELSNYTTVLLLADLIEGRPKEIAALVYSLRERWSE